MSVGEVSPSDYHNCVYDVHFRSIDFQYPIKAFNIKTTAGHVGSGEITDVSLREVNINTPIWYPIYIGPTQEGPSDMSGPACKIYPFGHDCPTQPLIDIKDIRIDRVRSVGGLLPPGVMRCNETNPCTEFVISNLDMHGWWQ